MYYDPNYIEWGTPTGWRCPGCGRCYSPTQVFCFYCGGGNSRIINSPSTNPGDEDWWEEYLKKNTTGKPYDNWVEVTSSGAYILHGTAPEVYYGKRDSE